jgi:hypothetical protein
LGYHPRIGRVRGASIVRLYSTELKRTLNETYDIPTGKKAEILSFPSWLDSEQLKEYVAGYFDGDGSVNIVRSGMKEHRWGPYQSIRMTFTSKSYKFLCELRRYLVSLGFTPTTIKEDQQVYRLKMYSRKNLRLFVQLFRIRHPVKMRQVRSVLRGEFVP